MRVSVWLVVVCVVLSRHLSLASAEAERTDTTPVDRTVHEHPPIVTDTQRSQRALPEAVTARVYTSPDISAEALRAALGTAEVVFVPASVAITWKICRPSECNTPPLPTELIVRFLHSRGRRLDTGCLGEALIDVQKRAGVLATVYVDRVFDLARALDIDDNLLLGRTIAHEIGHLLLATNTHSVSGLMREMWSREELLGGRADDWALQPFEAALIRQRLASTRSGRSLSRS
jgi:hypothetical protein